MAKDDFSKNEIILMFKEIKDTLERVEAQVIKTNGRVSNLELWREGLMGKLTVIGIVLSGAWALILTFGKHLFD